MKSWSLKFKFLAITCGIAFVGVIIGVAGFVGIETVSSDLKYVSDTEFPKAIAAKGMQHSLDQSSRFLLGALAQRGDDIAGVNRQLEKFRDFYSRLQEYKNDYQSLPLSREEEEKMAAIRQAYKGYDTMVQGLLKGLEAGPNYNHDRAKDFFMTRENFNRRVAIGGEINGLVEVAIQDANKATEHAKELATFWEVLISIIVVAGAALSVILGVVFSNQIANSLRKVASQLSGGAVEVADASKMISDAANELSSSTTEQAAALQETSSSLTEVTSMIKSTADNAANSLDVSNTSESKARQGQDLMKKLEGAVGDISNANKQMTSAIVESNEEISSIVEVINEIESKTRVINDIVFQTKLLSFNASVEAARAGEHGKGFAVVAEEVGSLAAMSGNAAREIASLLETSTSRVQNIVDKNKRRVEALIEEGDRTVKQGIEHARDCADALGAIVQSASELNSMIDQISVATKEQTQGVTEINTAMEQLNQVTNMNSQAANQSASASVELEAQSSSLKELVLHLSALIEGQGNEDRRGAGHSATSKKVERVSWSEEPKVNKNVVKLERFGQDGESKPAPAQKPKAKAIGSVDYPDPEDPRFQDL